MKSAMLQASSTFYHVASLARHRIRSVDPLGIEIFLSPHATSQQIGSAVRKCLAESREVAPEEIRSIVEDSPQREREWALTTAERFGYKSPKALYDDISWCDITQSENTIRIEPTNHTQTTKWNDDAIPKDAVLLLEKDVTDDDLGKGCREALSRCKRSY